MPADPFTLDVLDKLAPLQGEGLRHRAMFGGYGLYLDRDFFGITMSGRLYLHTSARTRPAYEAAGSETFDPRGDGTGHRYMEVPPEVLADAELLCAWVRDAAASRHEPA